MPRNSHPALSAGPAHPFPTMRVTAFACSHSIFFQTLVAAIILVASNKHAIATNRQVSEHCQYPCRAGLTCYATFNSAIAASSPGDTIFGCEGTYEQTVDVTNNTGPLVIKAVGAATIDGSNDYSDGKLWTQYNQSSVWSAKVPFATGTAVNQLFIDDLRYTYTPPLPERSTTPLVKASTPTARIRPSTSMPTATIPATTTTPSSA